MNTIERRDLEMIKGPLHERSEMGEQCDTCNSSFEDRGKRVVVMTTLPKSGELPKVEVLFVCNPSCDGSDGFIDLSETKQV